MSIRWKGKDAHLTVSGIHYSIMQQCSSTASHTWKNEQEINQCTTSWPNTPHGKKLSLNVKVSTHPAALPHSQNPVTSFRRCRSKMKTNATFSVSSVLALFSKKNTQNCVCLYHLPSRMPHFFTLLSIGTEVKTNTQNSVYLSSPITNATFSVSLVTALALRSN